MVICFKEKTVSNLSEEKILVESFKKLISTSDETLDQLLSNPRPTFESFFHPWEISIEIVFSNFSKLEFIRNRTSNNEYFDRAYDDVVELLSKFSHRTLCNKNLYKALHNCMTFNLERDQASAVQYWLTAQEQAGINLTEEQKIFLEHIILDINRLQSRFLNNVMLSRKNTVLPFTLEELSGVDRAILNPINNICYLGLDVIEKILQTCKNRDVREKFYKANNSVASPLAQHSSCEETDNTQIANTINALKQKHAHLFGFKNYAAMKVQQDLPDNLDTLLESFHTLLINTKVPALKELENISNYARSVEQYNFQIQPWDIEFYKTQLNNSVLNSMYTLFSINQVVEGIKTIFLELFNLRILETQEDDENITRWTIWENELFIGTLYLDLFFRSEKTPGAMMFAYHTPLHSEDHPIACIITNFDNSGKINIREVQTLLHELGHALHHILSKVKTCTLFGLNGVDRSLIEMPSQMMEFIFLEPKYINLFFGSNLEEHVLANIIAQAETSKIDLYKQILLSIIDLTIFSKNENIGCVSKKLRDIHTLSKSHYIPLHMENSFLHIFSSSYDAGYYTYFYSFSIADIIFQDRTSTVSLMKTFKTDVLELGGTINPKIYKAIYDGHNV